MVDGHRQRSTRRSAAAEMVVRVMKRDGVDVDDVEDDVGVVAAETVGDVADDE